MLSQKIQALIHATEVGSGSRIMRNIMLVVVVFGLAFLYDIRAYRNFNSPEAMDAAQVGRNLSEGRGYSTDFIRPFSLYLIQKNNHAAQSGKIPGTNATDFAQINSPHPDLANAPLYPTVLAALFKFPTQWKVETLKPFWTQGGHFLRFQPEFRIAILNQLLLFGVIGLTFLIAKKLFDNLAAWLAAGLTLGSDLLWRFSVSGLSTMLLLLIFLALIWCLIRIEELVRAELPNSKQLLIFAILTGLLLGFGMLTRYSFGWLIAPVIAFLILFGGARRASLVLATTLVFAVVVAPWIARNLVVSGTFFGTAGYAIVELPGLQLMQTLNPNLDFSAMAYAHKFWNNLFSILQNDLFHLGEGWLGALFFAGLLLGLRGVAARRLRYFTLMCLGTFILVQSLGADATEMSSENLLALMTPLVIIFGTVFFLVLLNQMNAASSVRYVVIILLVALMFAPLFGELLFKKSPVTYPPYYPPEIQNVSHWLRPEELMMSDVPWAVAWYGDHQCVSLTLNAQSEFFALNDYIKNVAAIYFTPESLDDKFFSNMARGGENSWPNFIVKMGTLNEFPAGFPLRVSDVLDGGFFLTDHDRWSQP